MASSIMENIFLLTICIFTWARKRIYNWKQWPVVSSELTLHKPRVSIQWLRQSRNSGLWRCELLIAVIHGNSRTEASEARPWSDRSYCRILLQRPYSLSFSSLCNFRLSVFSSRVISTRNRSSSGYTPYAQQFSLCRWDRWRSPWTRQKNNHYPTSPETLLAQHQPFFWPLKVTSWLH